MASHPAAFLTSLVSVVVLAVPAGVQAGGPDFGPDEAKIRQAQKLAATFRTADGVNRALRVLCRAETDDDVRHDAAFTVLAERAAAAMPKLLDAMAASKAPGALEQDGIWACSEEASKIAVAAVCSGRAVDIYEIDHRSAATIDRSRTAARRAVISALGKPGARRSATIEVLVLARKASFEPMVGCDASDDLVRLATPALVKMLTAKQQESAVLELFSLGGGDPAAAVPAVRPYVADSKRLALATLALVRMGQDMSQATAALGELLDGPDVDVALEALESIGPGAHSVLPGLAALSKRIDARCTKPVESPRLVKTFTAIATRPEDTSITLQVLSPLMRCASTLSSIARTLGRLGGDGRNVLLRYLRDEENTIRDRLKVVDDLQHGGAQLDRRDQELVRLLHAKTARFDRPPAQVEPPPEPARDPFTDAGEEFTACRAEAGSKPVIVTGVSAEQAGRAEQCLVSYLCGPSRSTLVRTLDRCCSRAFGAQKPPFCRP